MKEFAFDPKIIGLATATFYPTWYPGETDFANLATLDGKVRGDLALRMITISMEKGYQNIVVDGGSPEEFIRMMTMTGVEVQPEKERGMSPGRQQAMLAVSKLPGVEVVGWREPEKVSIDESCVDIAVSPLLQGVAEIAIPSRDTAGFATYPRYQAEYEQRANRAFNAILKSCGLRAADADELDAWIGPRFMVNTPEVVNLFLQTYRYSRSSFTIDKIVRPELWPNALFLPLVNAAAQNLRIASVDVPYRHPEIQTRIEQNSLEMERKRDVQYKNIIVSTIELVKLNQGRKSLLEKAA